MKAYIKRNLPYVVIALLVGYIVMLQECSSPDVITEDRLVVDSTLVDSLQTQISYLESLPPETVKVALPIPDPDTVYINKNGDEVTEYTTSYSDSLIVARWTTAVIGSLEGQDFEYVPKARRVIEKHTTHTITQYRTRYIRRSVAPKGYVSIGGELGGGPHGFNAGPIVSYTSARHNAYHVKYDIMREAILVGGTVKLSFSNLLPW